MNTLAFAACVVAVVCADASYALAQQAPTLRRPGETAYGETPVPFIAPKDFSVQKGTVVELLTSDHPCQSSCLAPRQRLRGTLQQTLASKTAKVGDQVKLTLQGPIAFESEIIPAGSFVYGRVTQVIRGEGGHGIQIWIEADTVGWKDRIVSARAVVIGYSQSGSLPALQAPGFAVSRTSGAPGTAPKGGAPPAPIQPSGTDPRPSCTGDNCLSQRP